MKRLFQKRLLVVVTAAFIFTTAGSWWIASTISRGYANDYLHVKLEDAKRQVEHTQGNLHKIIELCSGAAISSARSFARIVETDPTIIYDRVRLEEARNDLNVDELHVSDEKGVLIASIPKSAQGFDMKSTEQSRPFLEALTDPDFALWQKPMPNGSQNRLVSYAGVARRDKVGIVQIGYNAEIIDAEMRLADLNYIASSFRIGQNGSLRITDNVSPKLKEEIMFNDTVNGFPSLCLSIPCGKFVLTGNMPNDEVYKSRNSLVWILLIANLVLFTVIYLLVSILLQKVVVNGIYAVNNSLEKITNGDLEEQVKVSTTTEFEELSKGINSTVSALKQSIANEAKRIDAELEMGRTIQTSVLPTDFPDNENFCLSAGMFAAKEVGGDFYDFFMVDDSHLAVLIADVSGKGLTAALFMMGAKALLKEQILSGNDPGTALGKANKELCRNNKALMFLTAFLGVLDLDTGTFTCVNAGHNPPLLKHKDGSWEYLQLKHSVVLGFKANANYHNIPLQLATGDRLFLYTDGVTEAQDSSKKLYGEQRLKDKLDSMDGTPTELIDDIKASIKEYSAGVPQSDDITMLVLDVKNIKTC